MTAHTLRSYTAKDLAQMARERGVAGWHSMRKEELIRALVRLAQRRAGIGNHSSNGEKSRGRDKARGQSSPSRRSGTTHSRSSSLGGSGSVDPIVRRRISQLQHKLAAIRNLAAGPAARSLRVRRARTRWPGPGVAESKTNDVGNARVIRVRDREARRSHLSVTPPRLAR